MWVCKSHKWLEFQNLLVLFSSMHSTLFCSNSIIIPVDFGTPLMKLSPSVTETICSIQNCMLGAVTQAAASRSLLFHMVSLSQHSCLSLDGFYFLILYVLFWIAVTRRVDIILSNKISLLE